MIWFVGLALAGTKADLESGERALADNDAASAIRHYSAALSPPALKEGPRDQAWEGMVGASKQLLFVSTDPPLERARWVVDGWSRLDGQVNGRSDEEKKVAAELVAAALNAVVSANDPADADRMKGVAPVLTQLDQAGLAALTVGQYQLGQGDRDAAIETFRAAIAYAQARSGEPDVILPTVVEALAMQLWRGDPKDPEDEGDVEAALEVLEAGMKRLEVQRAAQESADLRDASMRLTFLRLTLLSSLPTDPRTVPAFEAMLAVEPDNMGLLLTFAGVHDQRGDLDAAEALYRKALDIDASQATAHYGLAAVYINRATKMKQSTLDMTDLDAISKVDDEAEALHLKAKPHLEAVLNADPNDVEVVRQLFTIAVLEDDVAAMERYKRRLGR